MRNEPDDPSLIVSDLKMWGPGGNARFVVPRSILTVHCGAGGLIGANSGMNFQLLLV